MGLIVRHRFRLERRCSALRSLYPQIQALADFEKNAVGFLPEQALQDAISRGRLLALTVDCGAHREVVGYLHYSGVFPHAKIQQIATVPKFRRQKVASTLMQSFVSDLERLGFMTITAEIAADLSGALAFYRKHDFEFIRSRTGGKSRKREILIHVRQLEADNLFTVAGSRGEGAIDLGIRRRVVGDPPLYAFDLNVYFDLAKRRENVELARQLFCAALAHHFRLVVADEFVKELQRSKIDSDPDPILELALKLPRIPTIGNKAALNVLAKNIHDIVFLRPNLKAAGSAQAMSDARHLAHAVIAGASGFVTRDRAILSARPELLSEVGIDVVSADELVELLPQGILESHTIAVRGQDFDTGPLTPHELERYLAEAQVPGSIIAEFAADRRTQSLERHIAIRQSGEIIGVGVVQIPQVLEPLSRLLIHLRPEITDVELFADYLVDTLIRFACADAAIAIELVHIPGQSVTHSIARARGFLRSGSTGNYLKIAAGHPVGKRNWTKFVRKIERRTGLVLPEKALDPNFRKRFNISTRAGYTLRVTLSDLEHLLSPTIIAWPGRNGVIVPIARNYADELLGTTNQPSFEFITNRDASFFSSRSYVNSPRTASRMQPGIPIFFYESKKTSGRGAIVAVGRIVDAVVLKKTDIPDKHLRRVVVDDISNFSASDDVLLTTFDNLLHAAKPVPFSELKRINATGGTNIVGPVTLNFDQLTEILAQGWNND